MASGDDFVSLYPSPSIRWRRLALTLFAGAATLVVSLWIAAVEMLIDFQVWLINGLSSFLQRLITDILGGGADLVVASWEAALIQAVEAGPLAPVLLALEAVLILTIAFAIWERRPYT